MDKLAIIGGGHMAGIFAQNAKEMDIETHCFSPIKDIVEKEKFDFAHDVNILDLNKLFNLCKKIKINGVVSTTELTIAPTAFVAEKLGLNGISFETAKQITDKYRNRISTKEIVSLKQPKYAEVYTIDDIKKINFKYPVILKPTSKGGKRGITVVKSEDDLKNAFEYAMKETNNTPPFIIEEYIEGGIECSVESLSYEGKNYFIQITQKVTSGPPHCVELGHHQPANISESLKNNIINTLDESLKTIGLTNGACHTEIKIKDEEIYLIEFNARPGGDHIAYPLTELSTGYPYIKGAINVALRQFNEVDFSKFTKKYAGVCFVVEQTKQLKNIFDNCEKFEWCYKKNFVSDKLDNIVHNDGFNKNYFIYCSSKRPNFLLQDNKVGLI